MQEAVADLIGRLCLSPYEIGAVVYASCSVQLWPNVAQAILATLGRTTIPIYGVWLGESGNFASVLRLARSLVLDGCRSVLVVVGDAVPRGPLEYRAMPNAVTVNGDGAGALLVTMEDGAYALEGIGQTASVDLANQGISSGLSKYFRFMSGVRKAVTLLSDESGIESTEFDWLIANNYSRDTLDDFADCVGVARERVFRDNVARYGHIFAVDAFINLAELTASGAAKQGQRILVLATGPFTWGALDLRIANQ